MHTGQYQRCIHSISNVYSHTTTRVTGDCKDGRAHVYMESAWADMDICKCHDHRSIGPVCTRSAEHLVRLVHALQLNSCWRESNVPV